MKYRIIGVDGKTYGPVGLEQIRQWLAQGRVDSRTPVFAEGASDWTFVGLLPELAGNFAGAPPTIVSPFPSGTPLRGTNGFATAGLIFGLLSWTCCCCLPFNLLGLVFSIIALVQINSQPLPQEGRGLAIVGLVLSALSLLCNLGFGIIQLALEPANFPFTAHQFLK